VSQGNDFCSHQKQQNSRISSKNPPVNGNPYTPGHPQHHDAYLSSHEQNSSHTQQNVSAPLYGIPVQIDVPAAVPSTGTDDNEVDNADEESNAKQVVKSLLRAMLAKPRSHHLSSLVEMSLKSEFDSGSEDAMEQPAVGADGKDDDSQSVNDMAVAHDDTVANDDTVGREDAAMMESESETAVTAHTWPSSTGSTCALLLTLEVIILHF